MTIMQKTLEEKLLNGTGDLFGIYRLRRNDDRFSIQKLLRQKKIKPKQEQYALAYLGALPAGTGLESIWETFNVDHPDDYFSASLSEGDIIVLRRGGDLSAHFVDTAGITDLPDFFASQPAKANPHEPIKCLSCGKEQAYIDSELYCSRCSALVGLLGGGLTMDRLALNFWEGCFHCGANIIAMINLEGDHLIVQCDNCGETHVVPFASEDIVRYIRSGIVREIGAD